MKDRIQKAIDTTWSNWCDLDKWIEEMQQRSDRLPKWVLKMAMKHLRRDMYEVHALLCELKDRREDT